MVAISLAATLNIGLAVSSPSKKLGGKLVYPRRWESGYTVMMDLLHLVARASRLEWEVLRGIRCHRHSADLPKLYSCHGTLYWKRSATPLLEQAEQVCEYFTSMRAYRCCYVPMRPARNA